MERINIPMLKQVAHFYDTVETMMFLRWQERPWHKPSYHLWLQAEKQRIEAQKQWLSG